jgi:hypothetical protein
VLCCSACDAFDVQFLVSMGPGRITVMGRSLFISLSGFQQEILRFFFFRSYEQYCDFSRQYDPSPSPAKLPNGTVIPPWTGPTIDTFIETFGRFDLLSYSTYRTRLVGYKSI